VFIVVVVDVVYFVIDSVRKRLDTPSYEIVLTYPNVSYTEHMSSVPVICVLLNNVDRVVILQFLDNLPRNWKKTASIKC
jgi:hypothetical protein